MKIIGQAANKEANKVVATLTIEELSKITGESTYSLCNEFKENKLIDKEYNNVSDNISKANNIVATRSDVIKSLDSAVSIIKKHIVEITLDK